RPIGADKIVTTFEDTALGFTTANFGFFDPLDQIPPSSVNPNNLKTVIITSLPTSGTLKVGGTALTSANLATLGQVPAGNVAQVTFTPATDANDANAAQPSFTFKVQDDGGTVNAVPAGTPIDTSLLDNTITVSVTSVNDFPVGKVSTVTTVEDFNYTFGTADFVALKGDGT